MYAEYAYTTESVRGIILAEIKDSLNESQWLMNSDWRKSGNVLTDSSPITDSNSRLYWLLTSESFWATLMLRMLSAMRSET